MKFTCCCFTCIIGQDEKKYEEEALLVSEGKEVQSTAEDAERDDTFCPPCASDVELGGIVHDDGGETMHRAIGVLKKYNVLPSKFDRKNIKEELLSSNNIGLKISIKIMQRSNSVKIFALEATNVMTILVSKSQEMPSVPSEEKPVIQLRSKLIPSDVRGHTEKCEVTEGITGAMKFMNECIHTMTILEFQEKQIRFRLYNVHKHHRDILLGEYILNGSALNLSLESTTTNIILQLHDPSASTIKPPEVCDKQRSLSSSSASNFQSDLAPSKSVKSVRRGNSNVMLRRGMSMFAGSRAVEETPQRQISLPARFEGVLVSIEERTSDAADKETGLPESTFKHLQTSLAERSESVEKLQDTTAEMSTEASNFSKVSVRLKEKYQKKLSKKSL